MVFLALIIRNTIIYHLLFLVVDILAVTVLHLLLPITWWWLLIEYLSALSSDGPSSTHLIMILSAATLSNLLILLVVISFDEWALWVGSVSEWNSNYCCTPIYTSFCHQLCNSPSYSLKPATNSFTTYEGFNFRLPRLKASGHTQVGRWWLCLVMWLCWTILFVARKKLQQVK